MTGVKTILILTTLCGLVLVAALVSNQPLPVVAISAALKSPPDEVPSIEERDWPEQLDSRSAVELLHRASARVAPDKVPWLQTIIWQQIRVGEKQHQLQGGYLSGPGDRFRLCLQLLSGNVKGRLEVVSDGMHLRETVEVDGKLTSNQTVELPPPGTPPPGKPARLEVLRQRLPPGLHHLLGTLQQHLQKPQCRAVCWRGRDCVEISGGWPRHLNSGGPSCSGWMLSRSVSKCRLYLDADSLWLHRLEWWGQGPTEKSEILLLETEYRQPLLNQPLPPERWAQEFNVRMQEGAKTDRWH